jgi:capsular polysaccharide biosynthesis protein/Flp pilus assembly protein TadD
MPGLPPLIVEQLFQRGVEHHHAGRFADAEAVFATLVAEVPHHPTVWTLLGLARLAGGDAAGGLAPLRVALAIAPALADTLAHHALATEAAGAPGAAAAARTGWRRALRVEPDRVEGFRALASLLRRLGRDGEAVACLERALSLTPDQGPAAEHLGVLLLDLGRIAAAGACFRRALALALDGDGCRVSRLYLARTLALQGRDGEAVAVLKTALAGDPADDDVWRELGGRLFALGREAGAVAACRRFGGTAPRVVAIAPAAEVCRRHGWPCHLVEAARTVSVGGEDGGGGEGGGEGGGDRHPHHVYELPDVVLAFAGDAVVVPSNVSAIVGGDTLLLDGFSTNARKSLTKVPHFIWHAPDDRVLLDLPEPSETIDDEAILLGGGVNWSHNVLDWASKLAVLERFPQLDHLPVLVSAGLPRSMVEFYAMLGLDPARLRRLPADEPVLARRLWLPSLTHRYQYTSPLHVDFLRRRLAGPLAEGAAPRPRRRLFLSRRNAGYRALLNEAEVLAALAPFGVEPLVPEDYSMPQQVALFASAELVVSPIGGASAAILFAPAGAACVVRGQKPRAAGASN